MTTTARSACRRCGRPILWAVTRTGRRMPVDADPDERGNVVLTDEAGVLRATVYGAGKVPLWTADVRHMPHHATCPAVAR